MRDVAKGGSSRKAYDMTRLGRGSFLVVRLSAAGAASLLLSCSTTDVTIVTHEFAFEGGACAGDASKLVKARKCDPSCPGTEARAFCVDNTYSQCSCVAVPPCDGGCDCIPSPVSCKGDVAMRVRSYRDFSTNEEVQCGTEFGYLLCNGTCFAKFSCDLPDGSALIAADGGLEGGAEGEAGDASQDAPLDSGIDGSFSDSGAGSGSDGGADAEGTDAETEAGADARMDARMDAKSDGSRETGSAD